MDALIDDRHLINGAVVSGGGDNAVRIVAPGDLAHSLLLRRMSSEGELRMPPLARHEPDRAALELFTRWIEQMPRDWNSDAPAPEPPPAMARWRILFRAYAVAVIVATVLLTAVTLQVRRTQRGTNLDEADASHRSRRAA
jgi:hypothetical protein